MNPINDISKAKTRALAQLADVKLQLQARSDELAAKRAALQGRIAQLRALPVSRNDLLNLMLSEVDRTAARYANTVLRQAVMGFARPAGLSQAWLNMQVFESGGHRHIGDDAVKSLVLGGGGGQVGLSEEWAAFFFGDVIKQKLSESFDVACPRDFPQPRADQPELDARFDELARLGDELAAVTAEYELTNVELSSLPPANS